MLLVIMLIMMLIVMFLATEHLTTTLLAVISVPGHFKRAVRAFLVAFGS